ncbi:hypothetical protein [Rathayibacter sp. AY1C1]|uniref:hypothetical protein n=1 Tax=Rathayibacter sp. AY1C1 TaxID=2080534 RepID=UPI0011B09092|nr:hypothetical protein [Rathayibacter sp. AY1C1]
MDEPITLATPQEPGAPEAQPVEQPAAADTTPVEPTPNDTDEPEAPEPDEPADEPEAPADDFDYKAWLDKKGIDPSTPEGQEAIAKSWREIEKKMHSSTQQASELAKQVNTTAAVDPDATEAQKAYAIAIQLQNAATINQWKVEANVTAEEDTAMGKYAEANPETAALLNEGRLTLDQFRALAVPAKPVDTGAIKRQGGQEALETLANKQRATSPTGSAATAATPPKEDPFLAGFEKP